MAAKAKAEPKKVGRPPELTPEIADAICERLAKGEPLARICEDEAMPSYTTVWRHEKGDDEFRKASARARELGTHYLAFRLGAGERGGGGGFRSGRGCTRRGRLSYSDVVGLLGGRHIGLDRSGERVLCLGQACNRTLISLPGRRQGLLDHGELLLKGEKLLGALEVVLIDDGRAGLDARP